MNTIERLTEIISTLNAEQKELLLQKATSLLSEEAPPVQSA